jgi:hypothetical protein
MAHPGLSMSQQDVKWNAEQALSVNDSRASINNSDLVRGRRCFRSCPKADIAPRHSRDGRSQSAPATAMTFPDGGVPGREGNEPGRRRSRADGMRWPGTIQPGKANDMFPHYDLIRTLGRGRRQYALCPSRPGTGQASYLARIALDSWYTIGMVRACPANFLI